MMPMNRARRFFEAGVEPAMEPVVVIRFVRERPDCTTRYTTNWDEMFPNLDAETSRTVRLTTTLLMVLLLGLLRARPAAAQAEPAVGVRAAGMGGAFTAVADDGSASFWNPAGLASGSLVSVTLDANVL